MATQNDSNELRVKRVNNKEIEEHLKANNIDLATVVFEAIEIEKALNASETTEGAATSAKVNIKDGKAANIVTRMIPITTTMEIPVKDMEEKEKEENQEEQQKEQDERE